MACSMNMRATKATAAWRTSCERLEKRSATPRRGERCRRARPAGMIRVEPRTPTLVLCRRGFSMARQFALPALVALAALVAPCAGNAQLVIDKQGAYAVGGQVAGDPRSASLHCDHGVAEYQIPRDARAVNLLMWHSASAVAWQNRWDG